MSDVLRRDAYFYMLFCVEYNGLYIGSTWDLDERMIAHKTVCNNPNAYGHNCQVYQAIRANGGWDNWEVMEIDFKKDLTRKERKEHEQYLIDLYEPNLNMISAHTNLNGKEYQKKYAKGWFQRNKERIKVKNQNITEENKEKITEYQKEYQKNYREENKERIKEYREKNKDLLSSIKKDWYQRNKEKVKEQKRKYREENRDLIKAKRDAKKKAK